MLFFEVWVKIQFVFWKVHSICPGKNFQRSYNNLEKMQELINFLSNRVVNLLLVVIKTDLACPDCLCENRNVFKDHWSFFAEPDQKTFDRCFPIAICDQNLQSDVVLFSFNNSTGHFWSKNWDLSRNLFFLSFSIPFQLMTFAFSLPEKKLLQ